MRRLRRSSEVTHLYCCQVGSFECPVTVDRRCKNLGCSAKDYRKLVEQFLASPILIMLKGYNSSTAVCQREVTHY